MGRPAPASRHPTARSSHPLLRGLKRRQPPPKRRRFSGKMPSSSPRARCSASIRATSIISSPIQWYKPFIRTLLMQADQDSGATYSLTPCHLLLGRRPRCSDIHQQVAPECASAGDAEESFELPRPPATHSIARGRPPQGHPTTRIPDASRSALVPIWIVERETRVVFQGVV